ncbi:DUF1870 family protein [Shewanella sp. BJSY2023SW005]|uniref:Aca2/YdiL-like domain-containing protein n=1 Tax=Shewanella sp. BJSY2023SW005 TaxID=3392043 RepID=UPI0039B48A68
MTNHELKQLRRLLFIEVSEAARLIGDCEPRTWQRWEKGDRQVPGDVIETLQMLALSRYEMLQFEFDETNPNYRYFETYDEFKEAGGGGNELKWRLAQSVSAALLCERSADYWRTQEIVQPDGV